MLRTRSARGSPRKEITLLVSNALEKVGLSGYEDRPAPALSGGQQQRVAIARAIVYEPKLLLLDEPFSNLDSKLREQMRGEIRKLLKGLGVTVLLVTHDQLEALGMSDRIAVMNCGSIEQIGNPTEVYDNPENPFVRDFSGRVVLLRGSITGFTPDGCIDVVLTHRSSASTAPTISIALCGTFDVDNRTRCYACYSARGNRRDPSKSQDQFLAARGRICARHY